MKREPKQWLGQHARTGTNPVAVAARDASDSDARLRAEVKQLRALVRDREARLARAELAMPFAALKPRRKVKP